MTSACSSCAAALADFPVQSINSACFCVTLEDGAVKQALAAQLASPEVFELIEERCPHLFSARPVFLSARQIESMAELIHAIELVMAMPSYRAHVLGSAAASARHDPRGVLGVFFGYDFHVDDDGIGLIEINTNAGGALLNTVLARAQRSCCAAMGDTAESADSALSYEHAIVNMFRSEWERAGHTNPLSTIAIVDVAPEQQYLYAEFLLFQQLFERHGIRALVCDPATLVWSERALWHEDLKVDLVYNRLTDFMLEAPASAALRAAYLANAVVLTPHPQAHALYADKRNLVLLSDPAMLERLGVPEPLRQILLKSIPKTELVSATQADRLWQQRRTLFFKPAAGYGGRAAYRGDKLTKRVWLDILSANYIAQEIVPPGRRVSGSAEAPEMLKFDIRCYTYAGAVQWTAARVYQGQTTNFRTPGGGFAPVYPIGGEELLRALVERATPRQDLAVQNRSQ